MWDLPGPGLEPVSPALAGGFLTTAPPGKSLQCGFRPTDFVEAQILMRAVLTQLMEPRNGPEQNLNSPLTFRGDDSHQLAHGPPSGKTGPGHVLALPGLEAVDCGRPLCH